MCYQGIPYITAKSALIALFRSGLQLRGLWSEAAFRIIPHPRHDPRNPDSPTTTGPTLTAAGRRPHVFGREHTRRFQVRPGTNRTGCPVDGGILDGGLPPWGGPTVEGVAVDAMLS